MCVYVRVSDPLEVELQTVVSAGWVLGTWFRWLLSQRSTVESPCRNITCLERRQSRVIKAVYRQPWEVG